MPESCFSKLFCLLSVYKVSDLLMERRGLAPQTSDTNPDVFLLLLLPHY